VIAGVVLSSDRPLVRRQVAVYLARIINSNASLLIRSDVADETGHFSFADLPTDALYTVHPSGNTYQFDPASLLAKSGDTALTITAQKSGTYSPHCNMHNESIEIVGVDKKARSLYQFIEALVERSSQRLLVAAVSSSYRAKILNTLSRKRLQLQRAHGTLLNQSIALPKVVIACPSFITACSRRSYATTVSLYRSHLQTMKEVGLEANVIASHALNHSSAYRERCLKDQTIVRQGASGHSLAA
jgi:hypothetical protein